MKKKFKKGQELIFNVHCTKVIGKFISFERNDLIKIEVTYDEVGVNTIGEFATIHKGYLVVKEDKAPNEKIVISGRIFAPVTERINGSDIDETQLSPIILPNFDYVQKMRDIENILEEILSKETEVLMSPIRFNGVHIEHIKQVFEKYGIVNEPKF